MYTIHIAYETYEIYTKNITLKTLENRAFRAKKQSAGDGT